jgi:antitoxin component YwqK of YwqJK toxin-antitoxin module
VLGLLALAPQLAAAPAFEVKGTCRDGLPHGAYELRAADGRMRVTGAFNHGKRTSSFLFWSAAGARIAHLPYDEGALSGTLVLWYPQAGATGEPRRQSEAVYAGGVPEGSRRTWYPSGHLRTELRYERGSLVEATAWSDAGRALSAADARRLAERDADVDGQALAALERMVDQNLPACGAGVPRPVSAG